MEVKYQHIIDDIVDKINKGLYNAGDRIYSENEMMTRYKVSQITCRRALNELERYGYIKRIKGKGSFVSEKETGNEGEGIRIVKFIIFCSEELDNSIVAIVRGVQNYLQKYGYKLDIKFSKESIINERRFIEECYTSSPCQGILIYPINPNISFDTLFKLSQKKIPFILIDRRCDGLKTNLVGVDNEGGGYLSVSHLIEAGHKKITFVADRWSIVSEKERYAGFMLAASRNPGVETLFINFAEIGSFDGICMGLADGFNAFVCANDFLAIKLMKLLKAKGLNLPEDASIIGFDDIKQCEEISPQLTTIRQPFERIGEEAGRMINQSIKNNSGNVSQVFIKPELIIRQSVKYRKINEGK